MKSTRLWTSRTKLRVTEGRGLGEWGNQVMGIKEEGTCGDEHWVL